MEGVKLGWKIFSAKALAVLIAVVFAVCLTAQTASAADPVPPTGLYVSATSTTYLTISWTGGVGSTSTVYIIATSSNGTSFTSTTQATSSKTYTASNLIPNSNYYFRVAEANGIASSTFISTSAYTYPATSTPILGTPTINSIPITINAGANPVDSQFAVFVYTTSTDITDKNYVLGYTTGEITNPSPIPSDAIGTSTQWSNISASGLSPNTAYRFALVSINSNPDYDEDDFCFYSDFTDTVYTLASTPTAYASVDSASQITITYSGDATSYDLTGSNGTSYSALSAGSKAFAGLNCGTSYTFTIIGNNGDGAHSAIATVSATTNGCGGGYIVPALPASAAQSSASVASQNFSGNIITLNLNAPDAIAVAISENADFSGSSWIDYSNQKTFALSSGNGEKTLYVKFRYANGTQTIAYKTTVTVSGSSSTAAPAAPSGTVSNVTKPKTNVSISLPVNLEIKPGQTLKYKYSYTNPTVKTQSIKIVRDLLLNGKIVTRATGTRTLKAGKGFDYNVVQTLSKKLKTGNYTVMIRIYDQKTAKNIDNNSFVLNVK